MICWLVNNIVIVYNSSERLVIRGIWRLVLFFCWLLVMIDIGVEVFVELFFFCLFLRLKFLLSIFVNELCLLFFVGVKKVGCWNLMVVFCVLLLVCWLFNEVVNDVFWVLFLMLVFFIIGICGGLWSLWVGLIGVGGILY